VLVLFFSFVECYFRLDSVGQNDYVASPSVGTQVRFTVLPLTAAQWYSLIIIALWPIDAAAAAAA